MNEQIRDEAFALTVMAEMFDWQYKITDLEDGISVTLSKNLFMINVVITNDGKCYAKSIGSKRFEMKERYDRVLPQIYKLL